MSLRSFLWLGLMACGAACGGADGAAWAEAVADMPVVSTRLAFEGPSDLSVVAGTKQVLRVRHLGFDDAPIRGAVVQFGLEGVAAGTSLESGFATTDADGVATMTMIAGGGVSSFQVRVSAEGAEPIHFNIDVVQAQRPTLSLKVSYDGARPIQTRSVSIVDNMSCEQLAAPSNSADVKVSYTLLQADQAIEYREPLGAGRRYAAVAWGSDASNSKLAKGCVEFTAPVTADADEASFVVDVALRNLPLQLAPSYDVSLALDARTPLRALAARTRSVLESSLPKTSTPDASFLLNLLASKVDNFAALRGDLGLDALFAERLAQSKAGPLRLAETWAGLVSDEGGMCSIEGQLEGNESSFRFAISRILTIRNGMLAKPIDSSSVPLSGAVVMSAAYSNDRAAIDVDTFKVPLSFGKYAVHLLNAIQSLPDELGRPLTETAGCGELQRFIEARTDVFTDALLAGQVPALCGDAVRALRASVEQDWITLDNTRASFNVRGPVFVHDRDGEGTVDDLGPASLSGYWAASGSADDTKVNATLRVTPKTTLAI